jgi:hypothetical protein
MCDVSCLMYDSTDPKSFEYIATSFLVIIEFHSNHILIVFGLCHIEVSSEHKTADSCGGGEE